MFGFGKNKNKSADKNDQELSQKLSKTRNSFADGLRNLFLGKKTVDEDLLDALETQLLLADVGVDVCQQIMESLKKNISRKSADDPNAVQSLLKQNLEDIVTPCEQALTIEAQAPFVILVVGVNGAGKTTTIGKLARYFQTTGKSVMLAAGDTFRAAAVEQLKTWGDRNKVAVVAQGTGADSASVIYDALQSAKAKGIDVLIADTAGRLHTQEGLMNELSKIKRVLKKLDDKAPHETLLVVDGGTGQNAIKQTQEFNRAVDLSGLAITKLDGTAKGGVLFALAHRFKLPIRFIGVGEQVEDLRPFIAKDFVAALLQQ